MPLLRNARVKSLNEVRRPAATDASRSVQRENSVYQPGFPYDCRSVPPTKPVFCAWTVAHCSVSVSNSSPRPSVTFRLVPIHVHEAIPLTRATLLLNMPGVKDRRWHHLQLRVTWLRCCRRSSRAQPPRRQFEFANADGVFARCDRRGCARSFLQSRACARSHNMSSRGPKARRLRAHDA